MTDTEHQASTAQLTRLCITVTLCCAMVCVVAWKGCEQTTANNAERIKRGQVYIERGWVTLAPTQETTDGQ